MPNSFFGCLESKGTRWGVTMYTFEVDNSLTKKQRRQEMNKLMRKELESLKNGYDTVELLNFYGSYTLFNSFDAFRVDLLTEMSFFDRLARLDLTKCGLKADSCLLLAEIIKYVKPLSVLILRGNEITDSGIGILAGALRGDDKPRLQDNSPDVSYIHMLDFRENPIYSSGIEEISKFVARSDRIITIEMEGINFSEVDERNFLSRVKHNVSLRKLTYSTGRGSGSNQRQKLAELQDKLQRNILSYKENMLKQMKGDVTGKWNKSKLMFVGQGRAGKTSTVKSVLGLPFDSKEESTIGASYTQIQTTTTSESKWLTLGPADAEYLGQGMAQESAASSYLQNKLIQERDDMLKKFNQNKRREDRVRNGPTVVDEELLRRLKEAAARDKRKANALKLHEMELDRQHRERSKEELKRQKRAAENHLQDVVNQLLIGRTRDQGNVGIRELRLNNVKVDLLGKQRCLQLIREIYQLNELRYDPLLDEDRRRRNEEEQMRQEMRENFFGTTGNQPAPDLDDMFVTKRREMNWKDGMDFHNNLTMTSEIKKDCISFSLCDFGGQEVFYTLHHLFLTKYGVYVLCVDLSEVLLKPKVCEAYMKFWFSSVSMHASSAPIVLVGTHFDAFDHDKKILDVLNEYFTEEKYFDFRRKYPTVMSYSNLFFYPVDNQQGIGIDELRNDIERITRNQEFVTQEISLKWIFCLETMMALRMKKPSKHAANGGSGGDNAALMPDWLNLDTVIQVARKVNLHQTEEIDDMLELFHELGVLVRLTGTLELSQLVVLNPQWLIDGLCCIIRDKELHFSDQLKGELNKAGLTEEFHMLYDKAIATKDLLLFLWKDEAFKEHTTFFLDMMKRMILLSDYNFNKSDDKRYLVPSLLVSKYEKDNAELTLEGYLKKKKAKLIAKQKTEKQLEEEMEKKRKREIQVSKMSKDERSVEEARKQQDKEARKTGKNIIKQINVRDKEIDNGKEFNYCVLRFSNSTQAKTPFLPTGLFQRLVCFCVSYSSSANTTLSSDYIKEPELYSLYARIVMTEGMIINLEQRDEEIWFYVEDPTTAPLCLRAITSILAKLNIELLGSGLTWEMSFKHVLQGKGSAVEDIIYNFSYTDRGQRKLDNLEEGYIKLKNVDLEIVQSSFTKAEAEKILLKPWFEPEEPEEVEEKVEGTLQLESFLDNFMDF
eukprot:snap_masked-scaffold_47-processed-gene-0.20-mRNA-1 protein AED:0.34 eAED:0.40 QI:0/-1/0/1/-1/1/1/0/1171